ANGDEFIDAKSLEDAEDVLHHLGGLGRVGPGGAEDGATLEVYRLDLVDGEVDPMLGVGTALHEVLEAVEKPNHLHPLLDRLDGDRTDDAVDARSRSATDDQGQLASLRHGHLLPSRNRGKISLPSWTHQQFSDLERIDQRYTGPSNFLARPSLV